MESDRGLSMLLNPQLLGLGMAVLGSFLEGRAHEVMIDPAEIVWRVNEIDGWIESRDQADWTERD